MLAVSQHHLIIQNKMAPILAVSQHNLFIQNKDEAYVGSFAALLDSTDQSIFETLLTVSQHYLILQIKAFLASLLTVLQPHLVIQFKDGVHVFLRDGTGCLRTKNLSNDTLFVDMFKIFFKIHLYLT